MGYFSNGSEGMDYEERYCRRCIHYGPENGPGCPVWGLHLVWNSEQNRNAKIAAILDSLIPPDGIYNGQCKMFTEDHRAVVHEMRCLECGTKASVEVAQ